MSCSGTPPFISSLWLDKPRDTSGYVERLGFVRWLDAHGRLEIESPVTIFTGDNGAGKSSLVEALAVSQGLNAEGGSRHLRYSTVNTVSGLGTWLRVSRPKKARWAYFLRAETHYTTLSAYESVDPLLDLHTKSHGETVMSMVEDHVSTPGLYIFDEPEAGLSPVRQMALVAHITALAKQGSQFFIATHSPILPAIPGAQIYELNEMGMRETTFNECTPVRDTRQFLSDVPGALRILLGAD